MLALSVVSHNSGCNNLQPLRVEATMISDYRMSQPKSIDSIDL
jgi:hypothetical protein